MTSRSTGSDRTPETRQRYRGSVRDRLGAIVRRIRRMPPVRGLLLVFSLPVLVLDDPHVRDQIVDLIVSQLPPLEDVAQAIVDGLADGARVVSIVGLIGFAWGASGFYLALEGAMSRLFPGPRSRSPILARVRGVVAVLLVVAGVLTAFVVSSVLSLVSTVVEVPLDDILPFVSPLVAVAAATGIAFVVYRIVPSHPPGWRAAAVPALLAGLGIGLLTSLFGVLAPLLVRGFSVLGGIASVFIALIWFNYLFQILLYCAAFARRRRDRDVAGSAWASP